MILTWVSGLSMWDKSPMPSQTDRVGNYNQLLRIEEGLGLAATFRPGCCGRNRSRFGGPFRYCCTGSSRTAQTLNSGIFASGSSRSMVSRLTAASA